MLIVICCDTCIMVFKLRGKEMKILEFVASLLTVLGLYMLSEQNSQGFIVGMVSNFLWLYWGHEKNALSLMALNGIMVFINLNGLGVL